MAVPGATASSACSVSMMLSSWRFGMHRLRSPGTALRVGRVVEFARRLASVRRPFSRSPSRCTSTLPPEIRFARLATWRA